jgi:hypothetical protein
VKQRSDSEERLLAKRKEWEKSTAKRIHVVVRSRPLNVKEIREDCKVRIKKPAVHVYRVDFRGVEAVGGGGGGVGNTIFGD